MPAHVSRSHRNLGQRGQIVVIFAGAIFAFVALCAIVIDVSWYWSNTLRMQRAADAAALAGVVWLPGNPALAESTAKAEATKNGYTTSPLTGVTVTAAQDLPLHPRRLRVTVSGPVNTYFSRVVGITSLDASRESKADFVLPVPMGSPQNWFGVGILKGTTVTPVDNHDTTGTGNSGNRIPTSAPGTAGWAPSAVGSPTPTLITAVAADDTPYAFAANDLAAQMWGGFGLQSQLTANQTIDTVDGIQVFLNDAYLNNTCATSVIKVALSWNQGGNWTSTATQTSSLTTTNTTDYTLGSASSMAAWGGHAWVHADMSDTNFRVRLIADKGCTTASREIRLDQLRIRVTYHTDTVTTSYNIAADPVARPVSNPGGGAPLATQGFWGAVITKGGNRGNGDRYSPVFNQSPTANADHDPAGYDYTVEVGASGKVSIYDPTYCATGTNAFNGSYGAGDHWIGTQGRPVTTVFTLYNINSTPLDLTDDISVGSSNNMFDNEVAADYSGTYGSTGIPGFTVPGVAASGYTNCAANPYHNAWWPMATGLVGGTYRLNVTTTVAGNNTTSAENGWSVWVSGGSTPRIYGGGRMVAYNNLEAGSQLFYLAQIDAVHAGKTMIVSLFDPGDVSGDATLRIKSPDGNAYNNATFNYSSDNGRPPGTNVTSVLVRSGGTSFYDNSVLTMEIPLPQTYGNGGLTPPTEVLAGWWKIEYTVGGGNDTTTWEVSIRGNPVHLVLP